MNFKLKSVFLLSYLVLTLARCGGSSSGGGEESVTLEEERAITTNMLGSLTIQRSFVDFLSGGTSALNLSALAIIMHEAPKSQGVPIDCPVSGTVNGTYGSTLSDITLTFSACTFLIEESPSVGLPEMFVELTGDLLAQERSTTYSGLSIRVIDGISNRNCLVNGRVQNNARSYGSTQALNFGSADTYDITSECNGVDIHQTGTLTINYSTSTCLLLLGTTRFSIVDSQDAYIECNYNNFNLCTASCADLAEACGLTSSRSCVSSGS